MPEYQSQRGQGTKRKNRYCPIEDDAKSIIAEECPGDWNTKGISQGERIVFKPDGAKIVIPAQSESNPENYRVIAFAELLGLGSGEERRGMVRGEFI